MSQKPESRLQRKIVEVLKTEVGGWWAKIHGGPFQVSGIPDLLGCVDGRFIALEVKRPGNKPTVRQLYVIQALKDNGAVAGVVYSPEDALAILKEARIYGTEEKDEEVVLEHIEEADDLDLLEDLDLDSLLLDDEDDEEFELEEDDLVVEDEDLDLEVEEEPEEKSVEEEAPKKKEDKPQEAPTPTPSTKKGDTTEQPSVPPQEEVYVVDTEIPSPVYTALPKVTITQELKAEGGLGFDIRVFDVEQLPQVLEAIKDVTNAWLETMKK